MANFQLSMLCLAITLVIYFLNKRLYRRFRKLPLMPLVLTPTLLVMLLVFGNISWQNYIGEAHWLLWLLGPATIAFAVPVYDNRAIIKRHWMSLTAGVLTATVVAVTSSVWLARLFTLPDEIQRSLAVRSVTTPFALAASQSASSRVSPRSQPTRIICPLPMEAWRTPSMLTDARLVRWITIRIIFVF